MWAAGAARKDHKVSTRNNIPMTSKWPLIESDNYFHSCSSRIHEEDYRQIQTNVPFLAPEILAVFANSQIFHDNQPTKSLAIVHKSPTIHDDLKKHAISISSDSDSSEQKLLKRLEGNSFDWTFSYSYTSDSKYKKKKTQLMCKNRIMNARRRI